MDGGIDSIENKTDRSQSVQHFPLYWYCCAFAI
jgi:hypothetical protein